MARSATTCGATLAVGASCTESITFMPAASGPRTDTLTFGFLLLGTILLVGALLFLPAAVLGPVAEHLGPLRSQPDGGAVSRGRWVLGSCQEQHRAA